MMIDNIETKKLYACDLCKRRIIKPIKKCCVCGKEICMYCRIKLMRSRRKYPDSGYFIIQEQIDQVCVKCAKKKLGIDFEGNDGR